MIDPMEKVNESVAQNPVPRHVAIIMDGNGRWARMRNLDRTQGHVKGVETVRRITEAAAETGVSYLTLYAFSTENWNRPKEEVDTLMKLIVKAIEKETDDLIKNNIRLTAIGNLDRLPEISKQELLGALDRTSHCTGLTLCVALSYSSRWEITEAAKKIAMAVTEGRLKTGEIDEATVIENLTTCGMPDPDLLIRTGGDRRISNFLLWQLAYAELYFTPTFWPDFSKEEFKNAIKEYQTRERRFGLTSEQITQ